jgi:hypothetical protein
MEVVTMKSPQFEILAGLAVALLGTLPSACAGEGPGSPDDEPARPVQIDVRPSAKEASASPGAAPASPSAAVRLEQAERKLDVGGDAAAARAAIEEALRDGALSPEQRDQAKAALSRALEAEGDREGAVTTIEGLLAEHADDHRWLMQERVEQRLCKLLTGAECEARPKEEDDRPVSPMAKVLARYFPETPQGVEINVLAFGGASDRGSPVVEIDRAVRALKREACGLCDEKVRTHTSIGRQSSWVGIPATRSRLGSSLAVFYFDLGDGRVPARYDAELPIPSAEIAGHLERGEGLVVARERKGAPPTIVVAAPRAAQLEEVEEALAKMSALPLSPAVVQLSPKLRAVEVQAVVRGGRKDQKACYEKLLVRSPAAAGRLELKYSVEGDGRVEGATVETESAALRDADFLQCLKAAASSLTFPATGARVTVSYPLVVNP